MNAVSGVVNLFPFLLSLSLPFSSLPFARMSIQEATSRP
jgi:hypothetical protein